MESRVFAHSVNLDSLPFDPFNPQMTLAMANGWLTKWLTIHSETIRSHSGRIRLNTQKNQLFLNLKSRLPWPIPTLASSLFPRKLEENESSFSESFSGPNYPATARGKLGHYSLTRPERVGSCSKT